MLNYKKPTFWILLVAIVAVAVLAVCFLTDPLSDPPTESGDPSKPIEPEVSIEVYSSSSGGVTFDIDGDGVDEVCSISHELALSAYFPYSISVTDNGELEYYNSFALTSRDVYFRDTNQGMLFCVDSDDVYWDYYYKISIVNDVIVLTPYDEYTPIIYYTGDQGVNKDMRVVMDEAGNVTGMEPLPVISNQIIPAVNMQSLERQYPQYFDLPTGNGLSVYIWQMSSQSYYCALVAGKDTVYTQQMLWDLHKSALTIDQARAIVNTYELDQSMVTIRAVQMPHSSYAYIIDDAYIAHLQSLFWKGIEVQPVIYDGLIMDSATFDIDNDGKMEDCLITLGPTSGLFTFVLRVYEDGEEEFYNIFEGAAGKLWFETTEMGETVLKLDSQTSTDTVWSYRFVVRNGYIALAPLDSLASEWRYWGPQKGTSDLMIGYDGEIIHEESQPVFIP